MNKEKPAWGDDWTVGVRVQLERGGRAVLGPDHLALLEAIDRCHSISAAARETGISYRHAWVLVQAANAASDTPFVTTATGGTDGGGARLTADGREALTHFRRMQALARSAADAALPRPIPKDLTDTVHVAAAVSLAEVLAQLLGDYAVVRPGVRVRTLLGGSDELASHLLAEAPADLFLSADPCQVERLEVAGLVEPRSSVALAENGLAAVGPAAAGPVVRRPADLRKVERLAVADAACPLGAYTLAYLEQVGLRGALGGRGLVVENSRAVLAAVRGGQADAGLVYISDARDDGCRLLFRVRGCRVPIRYHGVVIGRGHRADDARQLLEFLTSTQAARRFRRCGFVVPRHGGGRGRRR